MAVEARRQCNFRKIGGSYLCCDGPSIVCGRLPLKLLPCPLCSHVIPFSRGLARITPREVAYSADDCTQPPDHCALCPMTNAMDQETAGLHWIGQAHYSPQEFLEESNRLGISRRVPWPLPKWFELGKTWLFLAHIAVFQDTCAQCEGKTTIELGGMYVKCPECDGSGQVPVPGVFQVFKPQRVERIIPDTMGEAERELLRKEGLTLVEVPANDPDHQAKKKGGEDE